MNDTTLASVAGSRRAPDGAAPGGLAAFARALGSKEAGVPRLPLVRALLLPPVHAAPIASRATVQTGAELAQWPDLCERDGVGRLMHEPLIDVVQNRSAPNADVARELVETHLEFVQVIFGRNIIILDEKFYHGVKTHRFSFFARHVFLLRKPFEPSPYPGWVMVDDVSYRRATAWPALRQAHCSRCIEPMSV